LHNRCTYATVRASRRYRHAHSMRALSTAMTIVRKCRCSVRPSNNKCYLHYSAQ
jgi:hypothetical protein